LPDIPSIVRVERTSEGLKIAWEGTCGESQIQFSLSLAPASWNDVGTPFAASQTQIILPRDGPVGFYRVRSVP
jgi:hypothetical protein